MADPEPLEGETVSHDALLTAVHAHPAPASIEIEPVLALDVIDCTAGVRSYAQLPACVIRTDCPPTSNCDDRCPPEFFATLKLMVAEPVPVVGETKVIQAFGPTQASEAAILQPQVDEVEMLNAAKRALASYDSAVLETL